MRNGIGCGTADGDGPMPWRVAELGMQMGHARMGHGACGAWSDLGATSRVTAPPSVTKSHDRYHL